MQFKRLMARFVDWGSPVSALTRLAVWLLIVCAGALAADTGPVFRDIGHTPLAPRSGEAVRVTAQAPEGVTNVALLYQIVDPGAYVELKDPAYPTNWRTQPMRPGQQANGFVEFTADLPAAWQVHRRLVRYRFAAADRTGRSFTVPARDDPVPNFAYFVYDGVPGWTGGVNRRSAPVSFPPEAMRRVQSYFLLGKARSIENITWREQAWGKEYKYTGTLVADGVVYDHIGMRARGGVWRYAMGKNMWKFDFSKSQRLQARDDYGVPYPVTWSKVNLRACIQQGDYGFRGEQGMFESVGFRLFNLAGVAAPRTHWVQLRIVDEAPESPPNQYQGDYWGLYLAIEDIDGRFLKDHQLPDGNIYRMESGTGTLKHHGAGAVTNRADLFQFLSAYQKPQAEAWWRGHLDLPGYYSYRAICEGIHHYDVGDGKNYDYYFNPATRLWQVIPWDIDLTWANTMYGSGEEPFKRRVLFNPGFRLEYQNRLREIRDLLYNPEQTGRLINECAAVVADPAGGPSPVDADRAKWDYHPVMAMGFKAGQGLFYRASPTRDFRGMVALMHEYVRTRCQWIDGYLLNDPLIPATPVLTYTGPPAFPPDKLSFRASAFVGRTPCAAIQWRVAEIAAATSVRGRPTAPGKYEVTPVWQSAELTDLVRDLTFPAKNVVTGHTYRARVRMKDTAGRWSHWSAPVEFVCGAGTK